MFFFEYDDLSLLSNINNKCNAIFHIPPFLNWKKYHIQETYGEEIKTTSAIYKRPIGFFPTLSNIICCRTVFRYR